MAEQVRRHDWAATALGPIDRWPQSLRTVVEIVVSSHIPMIVLWGPDLIQIYNDGYRRIMGAKHPWGLGRPTYECWPEVASINAPIYQRVRRGETVSLDDALYPLDRGHGIENAWFTLSYNPLRDEAGEVAGVLVFVTEVRSSLKAPYDLERGAPH